jgi:hypothetical protein
MFQKFNLFLSSDEGRQVSTLLGPLEKANQNHRGPVIEISSFVCQMYFKQWVMSNNVGIMDEQIIVTNI